MKKKITMLLALLTAGLTIWGSVACFTPASSSPADSSPLESSSTPASPAVVDKGTWKDAFDAFRFGESVSMESNYSNGYSRIAAQSGNVTYVHNEHNGSIYMEYCVFDDVKLSVTYYEKTDEKLNWQKRVKTCTTQTEYDEEKRTRSLTGILGFDLVAYRAEETGENTTIGELYDVFTYNEEAELYAGTIYFVSPILNEQGGIVYEGTPVSSKTTHKFLDGRLIELTSASTGAETDGTNVTTFTYGETVTVPQEVLDETNE